MEILKDILTNNYYLSICFLICFFIFLKEKINEHKHIYIIAFLATDKENKTIHGSMLIKPNKKINSFNKIYQIEQKIKNNENLDKVMITNISKLK